MNEGIYLRDRLMRWFARPWVGITGTIFSILGVGIAVYALAISKSAPELTYYIYPARTIILKSGESSELQVLHRNREIKANITSVLIAIWNRGSKPIRSEDLLTNIQLHTEPQVPILEVKVRSKTRDVTHFQVDQAQASLGRIGFDWKILEEDDGALLQILLAGPVETEVIVAGTIVGQRSIQRISEVRAFPFLGKLFQRNGSMSPHSRRARFFILGWVTLTLGTVLVMILYRWGYMLERYGGDRSARSQVRFLGGFVFTVFLLLGLYAFSLGSMTPEPPFEF